MSSRIAVWNLGIFILSLFSICCRVGQAQEYEISLDPVNGLVAYDSSYAIYCSSDHKVYYAFDGQIPTESSPFFIGSKTFVHKKPLEKEPIWARVPTLAEHRDQLKPYMHDAYLNGLVDLSRIDSVGKITVITLFNSHDSSYHSYSIFDTSQIYNRHKIPVLSLTGEPNDLYGDHGIMVSGKNLDKLPARKSDRINLTCEIVRCDTIIENDSVQIYIEPELRWKQERIGQIFSQIVIDTINNEAVAEFRDGKPNVKLVIAEIQNIVDGLISFHVISTKGKSIGEYFRINEEVYTPMFRIHDDDFLKAGIEDLSIIKKHGHLTVLGDSGNILTSPIDYKISGRTSTYKPYKSLTIDLENSIPADFFNEGYIDDLSSIYLRNGSNSFPIPNDLFINRITTELNIGAVTGQPVVLYINGEYNGIRFLREKQNKSFVRSRLELKPKEKIIKCDYHQKISPIELRPQDQKYADEIAFKVNRWEALKSEDDFFSLLANELDIESFLKMRIVEAYFNKKEFSDNNARLIYLPNKSLFVELLKDIDFVDLGYAIPSFKYLNFKSVDSTKYESYRIDLAIDILNTKDGMNLYLNLVGDMLSSSLNPKYAIKQIDAVSEPLLSEIDSHYDRWHIFPSEPYFDSLGFIYGIRHFRRFVSKRHGFVKELFMNDLNLDTTVVYIEGKTKESNGKECVNHLKNSIKISSLSTLVDNGYLKRFSFTNVPLTIEADSNDFLYWENHPDLNFRFDTTLRSSEPVYFSAVYNCHEVDQHLNELSILEVAPNDSNDLVDNYDENSDWFKIKNASSFPIDLRGLMISDDSLSLDKFRVNQSLVIDAGECILVFADGEEHESDYAQKILHVNFKLNNRAETIYLSYNSELIDRFSWKGSILGDQSWVKCENEKVVPSNLSPNSCFCEN